jgi:3-hydroxyisobutyrate dehydrogenase-like beta-hydroxyacid dehydrogenase
VPRWSTGAEYARQAAKLCEEIGVAFVDCPVSGSTVIAGRGELGLMVGGDASVLEGVRPVLEAIGRTIVHVGPTGAGAAAKVAVNGLLHTFSTALAEVLVAAEAAGLTRGALFDVLASGVLSNTFLGYKREAFIDPDHAPVAFDLATAAKDLRLALSATQQAGLRSSVIQRALELHQAALDAGYGEKDIAAIAAWFDERSGSGVPAQDAANDQISERN